MKHLLFLGLLLSTCPLIGQWNTSSNIVQLNGSNQDRPVIIASSTQASNRGKFAVIDDVNGNFNDWLVYLSATQNYSSSGSRGAILSMLGNPFTNGESTIVQGFSETTSNLAFRITTSGNGTFKGRLNLNYNNPSAGAALRVGGDEALWYNGDYFSWGFGGTWNRFADRVTIGSSTPPMNSVGLRIDNFKDLELDGGSLQVRGNTAFNFYNNAGNSIFFRNTAGAIISSISRNTNSFKLSDLTQMIFRAGNTDLVTLQGLSRTSIFTSDINIGDANRFFWGQDNANIDMELRRSANAMVMVNRLSGGSMNLETQGGNINIDNTEANIRLQGEFVGINMSDPQHALHVSGDVGITGEFYALSDARTKKDVEDLEVASQMIKQFRPVTYFYKSDLENIQLPVDLQYGLIAQEVAAEFPTLVKTHSIIEEDGAATKMLGVNYQSIIPILIKALQEEQNIRQEQEERIAKLESQLSQLLEVLEEEK